MKLLQTIFILGFLILQFGCSKDNESIQHTPTLNTPISNGIIKINDIYFINSNLGFLVGTLYAERPIGLGQSSPYGPFTVVYKTINGGTSWQNTNTWDCGWSGNFGQSIIFTSVNNGLVLTNCTGITIWESTNQGASWSNKIGPGPYNCIGPSSFNIDNNTIIFGGIISRDGGQSFQSMPNLPTPSFISSFFFNDTTYGVCVSTEGLIYKSNDIGNTWDTLFNNTNYSFNNVYLTNNNIIFAAANGEIIRSTDGGLNWSIVYSNPNDLIKEIEFVNNQIGFAVTTGIDCNSYIKDCPYSRNGKILKTIDGGASWVVNYSSNSMDFECLKVINQNYYVVSGIKDSISITPTVLHRNVN